MEKFDVDKIRTYTIGVRESKRTETQLDRYRDSIIDELERTAWNALMEANIITKEYEEKYQAPNMSANVLIDLHESVRSIATSAFRHTFLNIEHKEGI